MKYIRTKDGNIFEVEKDLGKYGKSKAVIICDFDGNFIDAEKQNMILKQADTISELCDELVVVQKDFHDLLSADTHCLQTLKKYYEINKIEVLGIYGAIWTEWGLKYVAKMNDKGELVLL